jgi:SecD/SecF fusion protein
VSRYQKYFIGVIILTIFAAYVVATQSLVKGLDIAGGIRVVLQAAPKNPNNPEEWPKEHDKRLEKMKSVRRTIQNRVKGLGGVTEPRVVIQGEDRLVVELPGVKDPDAALEQIKSTAALEFYYLRDVQNANNPLGKWRIESTGRDERGYIFIGPRGETIDSLKQPEEVLEKVVDVKNNPPVLTGKYLLPNAKANLNQKNQAVVSIEFNREGTEIFRRFTRAHVGDYLAVFFDGKLLTAPTINEPIPSGKAEISGFRSLQEARRMAEFLNAGALPIPLKVIAKDSVEPTLGKETVNKVVVAGIVGLILVMVFMLAYYRLPGLIADVALCLYALYVIAAFMLIKATMSLAGVAALIISIGMAVDANILIFERLKEELRAGKTLRAAIDAGFTRAFTAIFDSNVCTAITCAILMWYGSPSVQSFATTLLIGVAISMFTAITVTRTILHLLVEWEWAQNPVLYGLSTRWFATTGRVLNIVGKRNWFFLLSAVLIVPGLVIWGMFGLNKGVEFKSGTSIQVAFSQPVQLNQVLATVRQITPGCTVQLAEGKTMAFITTDLQREKLGETTYEKKIAQLRDVLDKNFKIRRDPRTNKPFFAESSVEPVISEELTTNAVISVILASIAIVLYLSSRFAIGGFVAGLKFGVSAVIALIHDSAFIIGLFALLGKVAGWEIDSLFVTAVLTVIGFSVHDTIVVFDRIRENLKHRLRGESFEQLCNRSVLETLSRSVNTSLTVVLTLVSLIIFGGPLLRQFYVAMLAGIIIGTYSSIFCATPLLIIWEGLAAKSKQPKRRTFEEKPLVARPEGAAGDGGEDGVTPGELTTGAGAASGDEAATPTSSTKPSKSKRKGGKKRRF